MTDSLSASAHNPRGGVFREWLVVFVGALALYAATASRGVQWQDSGFHILRAVTGQLVHPYGLALSHPLHQWLARAVVRLGIFEPAFAVTLVSALSGAIAVANVYGAVRAVSSRRGVAVFAAASLALANTFWQMATLAETYTLGAALLAGETWLLIVFIQSRRRGYFWLMLLLNGLGIANHMLASLTTPVLAVLAIWAWRRNWITLSDLIVGAAVWSVGTAPYSGLVIAQLIHGGNLAETLHSALFGRRFAGQVLNASVSVRVLGVFAAFLVYSFPNLLLPFAIYGIARARRAGLPAAARNAIVAEVVVYALFVSRYSIVDQQTFMLPLFTLLCVLGGFGLAAYLSRPRGRSASSVIVTAVALLAVTPAIYAATTALARQAGVLDNVIHNKPYRDDYAYLLTPWSVSERSAQRMSRQAVDLARPDGLILVEETMASYAVEYQVWRTGETGVEVAVGKKQQRLSEAIKAGRPVVLVPADASVPHVTPEAGAWDRVGDLYALQPRRSH